MNSLALVGQEYGFNRDQINLIKNTVAVGATDDELRLFLHRAQTLGLDPFTQIHFIKRKVKRGDKWEEIGTIQTGIDGFRLIAERTKQYAPGPEATFTYNEKGELVSATAYVLKKVDDQWFTVGETAFFDEYCQRNDEGKPRNQWRTMPRVMLAKCAEARALRRAFPANFAGIYTHDEMAQADNPTQAVAVDVEQAVEQGQTQERVTATVQELTELAQKKGIYLKLWAKKHYSVERLGDLTAVQRQDAIEYLEGLPDKKSE